MVDIKDHGEQNSPTQTEDNLEVLNKGMVLDDLFTRRHLRELVRLVDEVKSGDLNSKYLVGFLTTVGPAEVHQRHQGLQGTLRRFISEDMQDLLKAHYGDKDGRMKWEALFEGYFEQADEKLVDRKGKVNLGVAELLLGHLENSFGYIETEVFLLAPHSSKEYLEKQKSKILSRIPDFELAIEKNGGVLSNGRRVDGDDLNEQREKVQGYEEALSRLMHLRKNLGNLILQDNSESE